MAGHGKWAKVKRFKGAIAARRAKEITNAAKIGGAGAVNKRVNAFEENNGLKVVYFNAEFSESLSSE